MSVPHRSPCDTASAAALLGPIQSAAPPARSDAAPANDCSPSLEKYWSEASDQERIRLLDLARTQGLLYSFQIPTRRNGAEPPATTPDRVLRELQSGDGAIQPLHPAPVSFFDEGLDAEQREAVARAMSTPDFCLIQGLPGTGKSRIVDEILAQAASGGQRILLLGHTTAAVDRILAHAGWRADVWAVRCVGAEERVEALAADIQKLTWPRRLEQIATTARAGVRAAELADRLERLTQDGPVWQRLEGLSLRLAELAERRARLGSQEQLSTRVEPRPEHVDGENGAARVSEMPACPEPFRARILELDAAVGVCRARIEQTRREGAAIEGRLRELQALAQARTEARWWRRDWWRAMSRKREIGQVAEWESGAARVARELETLVLQAQELARAREHAEGAARSAQEAEWQARVADLDRQRNVLEEEFRQIVEGLAHSAPRPAEPSPSAIRASREEWEHQIEQARREARIAHDAVKAVDGVAARPALLWTYANLVAGTLPAFVRTWPATGAEPAFDVLVWQEAQNIPQADFLRVASCARRWVLIGEPALDAGAADADAPGIAPPGRSPASSRPAFFDRLCQTLRPGFAAAGRAWRREGQGLCCQLLTLTPSERSALEREPVADRPDIELRILNRATGPVVAEIAFPRSFSLAEGKHFIYQELQELAVVPASPFARWSEEAERIVLRFSSESGHPPAGVVELTPGVRDCFGPSEGKGDDIGGALACATHRIEFERRAGWDRPRAEAWVNNHQGMRDLGRTVVLDLAHRMEPPLASFLGRVFCPGAYRAPRSDQRSAGAHGRYPAGVEFVPVPALARQRRRDLPSDGLNRSRQGSLAPGQLPPAGAGLETDLADGRQRERLPRELAPHLPRTGVVNYPEAQAVVRTIEALCRDWPSRGQSDDRPLAFVMSMYPGQVELVRRLLEHLPCVSTGPLRIEVDLPEAFRERECAVGIVSLTRSHTHRAVPFAAAPEQWLLALTRSRCRLVVAGDVGTLARRARWQGALDHLDPAAAASEQDVIRQLLDYLQANGRDPDVFRVREGALR
jgi:hypothetical protein